MGVNRGSQRHKAEIHNEGTDAAPATPTDPTSLVIAGSFDVGGAAAYLVYDGAGAWEGKLVEMPGGGSMLDGDIFGCAFRPEDGFFVMIAERSGQRPMALGNADPRDQQGWAQLALLDQTFQLARTVHSLSAFSDRNPNRTYKYVVGFGSHTGNTDRSVDATTWSLGNLIGPSNLTRMLEEYAVPGAGTEDLAFVRRSDNDSAPVLVMDNGISTGTRSVLPGTGIVPHVDMNRGNGRIIALRNSLAHVSDDQAATWAAKALGKVVSPRCIAANHAGVWCIGGDEGIDVSLDDGDTWAPASPDQPVSALAWDPGDGGANPGWGFVGIGGGFGTPYVVTSPDGTTWRSHAVTGVALNFAGTHASIAINSGA